MVLGAFSSSRKLANLIVLATQQQLTSSWVWIAALSSWSELLTAERSMGIMASVAAGSSSSACALAASMHTCEWSSQIDG